MKPKYVWNMILCIYLFPHYDWISILDILLDNSLCVASKKEKKKKENHTGFE